MNEEYEMKYTREDELLERIADLEKENADLEKENKELKTVKIPQLERKIASIRGAHSIDCKKLNAKKERAEKAERRLAKANKLLIRFVWASAYFNGKEADLVAEAKQFLQEE